MSQWDPFEEKTKRWEQLMDVLKYNMTSIVVGGVVCVIVVCVTYSANTAMKTNTMPCQVLNEKLEKFQMPTYYKLTPVNPDNVNERGTQNGQ